MNIFKSLTFWSLVAGIVAFTVKFFSPEFPFDEAQILAFTLFLLGLGGIYPTVALRGFTVVPVVNGLFSKKEFWVMVAGLVSFVVLYFHPTFPFGTTEILAAILFILGFFGVNPELRARGLK